MLKNLAHVSLVVKNLEESIPLWERLLGARATVRGPLPSGVRLATLPLPGGAEIELLQPGSPDSDAARWMAKHGQGVHHICLEVDDVDKELARAGQAGAQLMSQKSQAALNFRIGFVRAGAGDGVLVELLQKT